MARKLANEKLYVTVSREMSEQINEYAQRMGLTRSAFCSFLIGQGILSLDKAGEIIEKYGKTLISEVNRSGKV